MIKEVASTGNATSFHFLFRILFQPFLSAEVRQVLYLEILKGGIEAVSVWAGRHETYHDRDVVLQPGVAHHDIFLVVEGIEDFHGIQPSDSLDPYVRYRLVQCDDAPVGSLVGDDRAQVELAVHKLNTCLDVVFMVNAQHQSGLVETGLVVAGHFYLHFKLSSVSGVIERSVVHGKAIV